MNPRKNDTVRLKKDIRPYISWKTGGYYIKNNTMLIKAGTTGTVVYSPRLILRDAFCHIEVDEYIHRINNSFIEVIKRPRKSRDKKSPLDKARDHIQTKINIQKNLINTLEKQKAAMEYLSTLPVDTIVLLTGNAVLNEKVRKDYSKVVGIYKGIEKTGAKIKVLACTDRSANINNNKDGKIIKYGSYLFTKVTVLDKLDLPKYIDMDHITNLFREMLGTVDTQLLQGA